MATRGLRLAIAGAALAAALAGPIQVRAAERSGPDVQGCHVKAMCFDHAVEDPWRYDFPTRLPAPKVPQSIVERPASPELQRVFNATASWLARVGYPVRRVAVTMRGAEPGEEDRALAYPDRIVLVGGARGLMDSAARATLRGVPEAGDTFIHELLHQLSLDEGMVQAVAEDLRPAWRVAMRRQWPRAARRMTISAEVPAYAVLVLRARVWSTIACGCEVSSHGARSARRWAVLTNQAITNQEIR